MRIAFTPAKHPVIAYRPKAMGNLLSIAQGIPVVILQIVQSIPSEY